jgi:alkylhydroperoxidase family enzyme
VPHLELIGPEDADGLLAEEYDAAMGRAGKVYNIVRSMSLNPAVLRQSMELYKAIMFGPSGLTRQERELLATVVSATNECYY